MAGFGDLFKKVKANVRDVFDANTEADKQRRLAQGRPAEYRGINMASPVSAVRGVVQRSPQVFNRVQQEAPRAIKKITANPFGNYLVSGNAGAVRSIGGVAQDMSGLYDLITPGRGTNRFTQGMERFNRGVDNFAKTNNLNRAQYKVGQTSTDLASFMIPGTLAAKGISKVPTATKFGRAAVKIAPTAFNVATDMAQGMGRRTAKGQDNSWKTAGIDAGLSLGTAGVLKGAGKVLPMAGRSIKSAFVGDQLNGKDVSNILAYKNNRGGFADDAIHTERLNSLRKAGIDPTKPEQWQQIDNLMYKVNNAQTGAVGKDVRKPFVVTKESRSNVPGGQITQKGFTVEDGKLVPSERTIDSPTLKDSRTNTTGIKNYNPDGLPKEANDFVHQYAKQLEDMGSGQGVAVVDGKRISNNSPAYRELYAKLGRKPTSKDWYDLAYDQLNSGTDGMGLSKDFGRVLDKALLTDKQIQDPSALLPKGATPIKNQRPSNMSPEEWDSVIRSRVPDQKNVKVVQNPQGTLDIQKTSVAPVSGRETIDKTISTNSMPEPKAKPDGDFIKATNTYLGSIQSAETTARMMADELPYKLKGQDAIDAIVARDNGIQTGRPEIDQVNARIQGIYDNLYAQYRNAGFDMGYVDNYSPRIYKHPKTGQPIAKDEFLYLTRTPGQTIERTAKNVNPENLLYKTPQELLAHYTKVFERAKAGRQYFDNLKGQGFIVEAGTRPDGMVVIDAPGMPQPAMRDVDGMQIQGNYYAYPDVAKKLNKVFGVDQGNRFLKVTAKGASIAQDIGLSGGVPGTPINAFTFAQMTKELSAGKIRAPFKALWNARSSKGAQKYFKENAKVVTEMQKNGISVTSEYNPKTLDGIGQQIDRLDAYGAKAGVIWDKVMSDPTFRRFMPSLQVETYKQVKNKYVKKLGEERASEIASAVVKNFYGLTDLTSQATRSKTLNDLMTTVVFAPKYRESMARFWVNNAKAIDPRKWLNPEYAMNVRFNIGSTLLFGAMQAANLALNGTTTFGNPDGKKDKLIIPSDKIPFNQNGAVTGGKDLGIPFLSSIATVPRAIATGIAGAVTGNAKEVGKSAKSMLGFGIRPLADLADNENYFGSRIYDPKASTGEKLGNQGSYLFKAYQHPYIREGLNVASSKLPEGVKKFVGGKEQTPFETASKAAESPLRFYDPEYYRGGADNFQANAQQASEKKTLKMMDVNKKKLQEDFDSSLSDDDRKILGFNDAEKAEVVRSGIKTPEELKGLEIYALNKKKELGIPVGTLPDNYDKLDADVQAFLKEANYIHPEDKDSWAESTASGKFRSVLDKANQIKPADLPKLPDNMKVVELYADFKSKQQSEDWNPSVEMRKKKEFLRDAYKTFLTKDEQSITSLNDTEIYNAAVGGDIPKDIMDKIVSYDDFMMGSGLGSQSMIGNKLRRSLGYGDAPKPGGSTASGSGKGGRKGKAKAIKFSSVSTKTPSTAKTKGEALKIASSSKKKSNSIKAKSAVKLRKLS